MTTHDSEWANASCHCGHPRYRHTLTGTGACLVVTTSVVFDGLPAPEYAPGTENHPSAWPLNWPPLADLPVVDVPCDCEAFRDPESPEDAR